jgi:hypothetical protein
MGKGLHDIISADERGAAAQREVGAGNAEREERAKQESEKLEEEEWMKYEEQPRRKQIGGGRMQQKGGGMDSGESMVGQHSQDTAVPRKKSVRFQQANQCTCVQDKNVGPAGTLRALRALRT